jgi:hypothetical protein
VGPRVKARPSLDPCYLQHHPPPRRQTEQGKGNVRARLLGADNQQSIYINDPNFSIRGSVVRIHPGVTVVRGQFAVLGQGLICLIFG